MDAFLKSLDDVDRKMGKIAKLTEGKTIDKLALKDVVKMSAKGNSIHKTLTKGIKSFEADSTPVTEAQQMALFEKMKEMADKQAVQMKWSRDNKPAFDKLHVAGMVKKNLVRNEGTAASLSKIMLENTPSSKSEEVAAIDKRNKAAFRETLDTYSNATGGEDTGVDVDDSE